MSLESGKVQKELADAVRTMSRLPSSIDAHIESSGEMPQVVVARVGIVGRHRTPQGDPGSHRRLPANRHRRRHRENSRGGPRPRVSGTFQEDRDDRYLERIANYSLSKGKYESNFLVELRIALIASSLSEM
ncbi:hypothetical protein Nepgr_009187 [Nepenthes gracilis]|uniref:Uncharacterized protein n=1 Tax=Nepenthes gracilis TaxID=150966 RepID=A0AAD3XJX6_NEPGR|nr:hypothetical protein Nepgr_009187 [Nepenthes gracilis]